MPTIGTRKSTSMGRGYANDPLHGLAKAFVEAATNIRKESTIDLFTEGQKAMTYDTANDALKEFFVNESFDPTEVGNDPEKIQEQVDTMDALYANDRDGILEHTAVGAYNPVIGLTFPLHKNILMNNVFDKAIPKFVANSPKFTFTMENRILRDTEGNEIDIFKDQNKIYGAIENSVPFVEVVLALPESQQSNILVKLGASELDDSLSIETFISGVVASSYVKSGDSYVTYEDGKVVTKVAEADGMQPVVFKVNKKFTPAYGEFDRQLMDTVSITVKTDAAGTTQVITSLLTGFMKKNRFMIQATDMTKITHVVLNARIDASSAMVRTCSYRWEAVTTIEEIPDAKPINVTISPEEIKDISALYNVNQLTKIMSGIKTILGNWKDDKIRNSLDESFKTMPATNKLARNFDFEPRDGYALDYVEWRHKTFMDMLDSFVSNLFHVLNDPNMTVTVVGRDDLIRKITPTEYTYQTPSSIGPVELDFVKTVVTSDKRVYQFISSDKLRNTNNLIVILCPRNTERVVYRIYDYQMFLSNEIRNSTNYALPAVHAFDRWKFVEYQPVQGRVKILNPMGRTDTPLEVADPIGNPEYKNDWDVDYTNV